jgi:O-antigen/teichoic acid export membrane protein
LTIARNAALNLAGHGAPLVAAIFLVPPLVARLDPERFGFLALVWALVGYLALFDLGIGRALTRLVAESRERDLPGLSRTALSLTLFLGAAAGLLLFVFAPALSHGVLGMPAALQVEAAQALRLVALYLPLVTLTAALRGILEGRQQFGQVNAIRAVLGVLTFAAPLAATAWSTSLVLLVGALGVPRLIGAAAHWAVCRRAAADLTGLAWPRSSAARRLLAYGGWLTVSNIVGPLMVYADRFVIGTLLAVSAVGYYSAPYEVVTRLWLVPAALTGVLFPAMAAAAPERLAALYRMGVKTVLAIVFPITLAIVVFAAEGLRAWLGQAFAAEATRVAQLLALGVAVNCLAYLPFTMLQARGRARLTAKTHLCELPLYAIVLIGAISLWGIEGAAFAWALRCACDAAALFALARSANGTPWGFNRAQLAYIGGAFVLLAAAMAPVTLAGKALYLVAGLIALCVLGWAVLFDRSERSRLANPLGFLSGQPPP